MAQDYRIPNDTTPKPETDKGTSFELGAMAVLVAVVLVAWLAIHFWEVRKEGVLPWGSGTAAEEQIPLPQQESTSATPSAQ